MHVSRSSIAASVQRSSYPRLMNTVAFTHTSRPYRLRAAIRSAAHTGVETVQTAQEHAQHIMGLCKRHDLEVGIIIMPTYVSRNHSARVPRLSTSWPVRVTVHLRDRVSSAECTMATQGPCHMLNTQTYMAMPGQMLPGWAVHLLSTWLFVSTQHASAPSALACICRA